MAIICFAEWWIEVADGTQAALAAVLLRSLETKPALMLSFAGSLKVLVALEPRDMRNGFNGLRGLVTERLQEDPRQGGRIVVDFDAAVFEGIVRVSFIVTQFA